MQNYNLFMSLSLLDIISSVSQPQPILQLKCLYMFKHIEELLNYKRQCIFNFIRDCKTSLQSDSIHLYSHEQSLRASLCASHLEWEDLKFLSGNWVLDNISFKNFSLIIHQDLLMYFDYLYLCTSFYWVICWLLLFGRLLILAFVVVIFWIPIL